MFSYRIEQAVRAAAVLHKDQVRKGTMPFPYVTHLVSVAFILHDYTDDEDVIIAGLLHDTIEDTDYTLEELKQDFGVAVSNIVSSVTEPKTDSRGNPLPWPERKLAYVKQLKSAAPEALLVSAADKIHNMRMMVEVYYDQPSKLLNDFGGTLEERLEHYQNISNVFNRRLNNDIIHEFNHVFSEFKDFIRRAQDQKNQF